MGKVRARHQGRTYIYIHNDLANAAHHFHEQIKAKTAAGDRKGLAFERLACLTTLAFTFEAQINFFGHKKIAGWDEWQPFNKKVKAVFSKLKIVPDWKKRPYSSVAKLKQFRDLIAHGKPKESEFDEIVEESDEDVDRKIALDNEWVKYCSQDNVSDTYEDVDILWNQMLEASELHMYDTITRGESGLTVIERLSE